MDVDKGVNEINQLRELTKSGKRSLPKLVKRFNTQNLEKKEKPSIRHPVDNFRERMGEITRHMSINKNNY